MRKILSHLKEYKLEAILGPLFKLLEAGLELIVPLIVSKIIDDGIKGVTPNQSLIIKYCGILIAIAVVGFAFSITGQYFNAKATVGLSKGLRKSIYTKIQELSYSDLDKIGTSSLITRMTNDVNQIQVGVNLTLRLLLRSPIVVFGAFIMAYLLSPSLSLIFVGVIVLLLLVVLGIMFICVPLYRKVQGKLDSVTLSTRENLVGARVIRAFTKEEDEIKSYKEKNKKLAKSQKGVGVIAAFMNPLTFVVVNFGVVLLIKYGAINVESGALTQGQVIALYDYLSIILVELVKMANLVVTLNKSIACGHRVNEVLKSKSSLEHIENDSSSDSFIEFKNVSLTYHKGSEEKALSNISFKVNKGETIGIIGGTGSGKTSIVNLMPHFYDVSEGEVIIDNQNVASYDDVTLRDKFGIVPQKAVLFKGTIRSNLEWGNDKATDEDLKEALDVAQASDFVSKKEKGIDSVVEESGSNFSGGQKQRLCIARALVRKPEILVLDDSTSALDYATDMKLRKALKKLSYKPTVFIISQRTSSIQHADQIIVLDDGKIVGIGKHEDLLNTCEIYQEIHYSQVKKEGR